MNDIDGENYSGDYTPNASPEAPVRRKRKGSALVLNKVGQATLYLIVVGGLLYGGGRASIGSRHVDVGGFLADELYVCDAMIGHYEFGNALPINDDRKYLRKAFVGSKSQPLGWLEYFAEEVVQLSSD